MAVSTTALKEWSLVIDALQSGDQLLLFRKGGIRDPKGAFQLQHSAFLLYPTLEHQKLEAVRPEFQDRFKNQIGLEPNPPQVTLNLYAQVEHLAQVQEAKKLSGLEKYHVWTPQFFEARMTYRPQSPTLVVVLRAYQLANPIQIPVEDSYVGCKSWVPLTQKIEIDSLTPVVDDQKFNTALQEITSQLS